MNRSIIQSGIENSAAFTELGVRRMHEADLRYESEQPTIADFIAPGTGRSISAEFECLLSLLIADGGRS